jgi:SAM-dependent methyltransferase
LSEKISSSGRFYRFETQSHLFTQILSILKRKHMDLVADYGCGYGRHTLPLAINGFNVVSLDSDQNRLKYIHNNKNDYLTSLSLKYTIGSIQLVHSDIINYEVPIRDERLSGAVCIHFPDYEIVKKIIPSIKQNGFLLFETFDGHGRNYELLPEIGYLREVLERNFTIDYYKENVVGPSDQRRATVRMFGYKRK